MKDLGDGFDLDVKNPNSAIEEDNLTVDELLKNLANRQEKITGLISDLTTALRGKS